MTGSIVLDPAGFTRTGTGAMLGLAPVLPRASFASGYRKYHRPSQTIGIQFTTGCLPLCEGQLKGGTASFKGTQACGDGYGRWGAKSAEDPIGSGGTGSSGPGRVAPVTSSFGL
jgi:hypothetical protein